MGNQHSRLSIDLIKAIELYKSGMSQRESGLELGTTQKVICTRLRQAGIDCSSGKLRGDKHPRWKGDEASYGAFHQRVHKLRGMPLKCEWCGTDDPKKNYDWASLTKNYKDPTDYARLCRRCHWIFDDQASKLPLPTKETGNLNSKLKEPQIRLIKRCLLTGISQRGLAKIFRVTPPTIRQIAIGVAWKNIQISNEPSFRGAK